ncbi:hypothetical protein [Burkholderia stagnalis]
MHADGPPVQRDAEDRVLRRARARFALEIQREHVAHLPAARQPGRVDAHRRQVAVAAVVPVRDESVDVSVTEIPYADIRYFDHASLRSVTALFPTVEKIGRLMHRAEFEPVNVLSSAMMQIIIPNAQLQFLAGCFCTRIRQYRSRMLSNSAIEGG